MNAGPTPDLLTVSRDTSSEAVLVQLSVDKTQTHSETSADREARLQRELKLNPDSDKIKAIPFEWIGKDITIGNSIYPSNVPLNKRKNFPDWHKLTPAYRMKFSGRSPSYLITSLFNPTSNNNIPKRIARWAMEDHSVQYSTPFSKLAALVAFGFLLMTLVMTIYEVATPDQTLMFYLSKSIKLAMSIFSGSMLIWSVFKRTTIPARDVVITSFEKGIIESDAPRHKKTLATLVSKKT